MPYISLKIFWFIFILCVWMLCLHVYVSITCVSIRTSGTGFIDLVHGCWKPNTGLLKEQQVSTGSDRSKDEGGFLWQSKPQTGKCWLGIVSVATALTPYNKPISYTEAQPARPCCKQAAYTQELCWHMKDSQPEMEIKHRLIVGGEIMKAKMFRTECVLKEQAGHKQPCCFYRGGWAPNRPKKEMYSWHSQPFKHRA